MRFIHPIPSLYAFEPTDQITLEHINEYLKHEYPDIKFHCRWVNELENTREIYILTEGAESSIMYALKYNNFKRHR